MLVLWEDIKSLHSRRLSFRLANHSFFPSLSTHSFSRCLSLRPSTSLLGLFTSATMKGLASSLSLGLLAAGVAAQVSPYGQCGGTGYSGSTSCASGYECTSQNPYYYQCVPGTAPATSGSTSSSSAKTTTSASSVVSLHPLELRAGPGALGAEVQKKRSCGGSAASAETAVVTLATSVRSTAKTTTAATSKTTSATASKTTTSAVATATGTGTFATTDGLLFSIDGESKYFAGTNCYWCGFLTEDEDVDSVFSHMADAGFKIVRVWGFNDVNTVPSSGTVYYQYLSANGSTINTGADGLERLDAVVASAEKYGLKLIINFVNNWTDYGGIAAYVAAFGGSVTSWFTDSASQAQYQTYIKAVVSRYQTSTAVFAWELANEPRCSGCDTYVYLIDCRVKRLPSSRGSR